MGNDDATWRVVELAATFRIHIRSQRERTAAHKGIWAKYLSLVHDHYIVYTISWWWWLYRCVAPDLSLQNINERESPENRGGWDAMRLFFFVFRYLSTSALFLSLFRIEKPLQSEIATTKIYISRIYNIQFSRSRKPSGQQLLFKLCAHQSPLVCIWHGTTALQRFSICGQLAMEKEHLQRAICVNGGK